MNVEIVPATVEHAVELSTRLRKSDVRELKASSGRTPLEALVRALRVSDDDMTWTALVDGSPEVIWGVSAAPLTGAGCVWLLASDAVYSIKKTFLSKCPSYINLMHTRYRTLFNWVDIRHSASLSWLYGLGFTAVDYSPRHGNAKKPFLMFMSIRD
jgi:hypothetical protein